MLVKGQCFDRHLTFALFKGIDLQKSHHVFKRIILIQFNRSILMVPQKFFFIFVDHIGNCQ